jgi:predicted aspartyl protease
MDWWECSRTSWNTVGSISFHWKGVFMGVTKVLLKVYGTLGSAELEALVDTGATFTKIPRSVATRIGLQQGDEIPVELGDGRVITRRLASAEVEVEGTRRPILLTLANDGEAPLLGYTTLELLGFKVNPVTQKLEKTMAIEYREKLRSIPRANLVQP